MNAFVAGLPSGRRGQALAVGIAVALMALVWLSAVSPLLDWYANRQAVLAQRLALAGRMASVAAMAPALQRLAVAGNADPASSLLQGATEAVAGAGLQQRLQEMSERAGLRMTSAEVLASEPSGAYRRVRVHVAVSGPWARLVGLLSDMDHATPRMAVSEMQVGQSRSVTTDPVKPLDAVLTVVALYAGRETGR